MVRSIFPVRAKKNPTYVQKLTIESTRAMKALIQGRLPGHNGRPLYLNAASMEVARAQVESHVVEQNGPTELALRGILKDLKAEELRAAGLATQGVAPPTRQQTRTIKDVLKISRVKNAGMQNSRRHEVFKIFL